MRQMKYVVIDNGRYDQIHIFCDAIPHNDMVNNIGCPIENVVSAGFVTYGLSGRLECYGESVGLDIKSRPDEDTKLLDRELRGPNPY